MTMDSGEQPAITEAEVALRGTLVEGTVVAVFRWGVIVHLKLSHAGLIDALYVDDDDRYEEADQARGTLHLR